jgi:DNA gyrase subunit A
MSNYITNVDILDESKDCFLTYAEEVLTDRAIPAAEDGLLSVHRKLIWTMENVIKMTSKSKFKKSASVVGTTLSSCYYHGDAACYGALCKLTQKYLMRYPLVIGDGNLGTQEGNGMEAAARYTNVKPSQFADLMYEDYKKNVVPTKPTYNEEYVEPVVLPSLLPNAICNGRESIGIGLSHSSLPHCLTEVCNVIIEYIKKGSLTLDEIMEIMPGPDFPLENVVINSKDIKEAYRTGHSKVSLKVRGCYEIKGQDIIFTTIPYRTYRNKIKEQITKNIDDFDKIIDDFRDESNVGKNRLVFHCKDGVNPESAVNIIFNLTDLQTTLSYNMNFIVNGTPKLCSMAELIEAYITHQVNVLLAATKFDKDKAESRKHVLDGLLIAMGDIDKAIELIRSSKDKKEAEEKLTSYFAIDEIQAQAILDMKLAKLTKLDKEELEKELKEKIELIEECNKIIEDKEYRNSKIIEKLENLRDKYGDERRTKLLNIEVKPKEKEKEVIIPEDCVIVMEQSGNIKKVPKKNFKTQKRNGKGIKTKDDVLLEAISTNTIDTLMLFSNKGKMYRLTVDDVPTGTNAGKGVGIGSLIPLDYDEKIIAVTSLYDETDAEYVVFITKQGLIKKTELSEYENTKRKTGIVAIKLKEGDSIANVTFLKEEDLFLISKNGMAIHFETGGIKATGRNTSGVKGIKLGENDYVKCGLPLHNSKDTIAIFTEDGNGKRIELTEIPVQGRGGKGIKVSDSALAGAIMVDDNDNILITGNPNSICISAKEISVHSKTATGSSVIKNSKITKVTKL